MSWESLWSNRCSDGFGRRFWTQGPQFWAVHRWIWQKMLMTCNKFDAKYLALNHWISTQWNHWPSILEEHSTKHLGRGWNGVLYFQTKAEDGWAAGGTPDFGNVLFSDCKGRLFVAWFMIVTRSVEKCVASWCMMIHALERLHMFCTFDPFSTLHAELDDRRFDIGTQPGIPISAVKHTVAAILRYTFLHSYQRL